MSGAHSILPPSGAAAWRRCPMWVTMNKKFPQADTPETIEGTTAHWVFAEMLAGRIVCEGLITPDGQMVTEEMIEGGQLVVDAVAERMPAARFSLPKVEQPVDVSAIHPDCWGTPDIWAFALNPNVLEVIDYKYGHRFVDEFENDQGIAYCIGIVAELSRTLQIPPAILDQSLTINFTVIQPRCFYKGSSVRTWSFPASDLRNHMNALANAAAMATGLNTPPAKTNSECQFCPGRHACDALQKAAYNDAEFSTVSTPIELTSVAASLELKILERSLERIQARVDGLKESVAAYGRQGQPIPWHRLEQSYGRQVWNVPTDQVLAMGEMMGVSLSKPGVITPKAAIKNGIDEAVIMAYSAVPAGVVKLIPNNPADARRVFGK